MSEDELSTREVYEKELERHKARMEAYRAMNENLMCQAASNFSKYIITLSAGALGLSLTFLSTILQGKVLNGKSYLFVSWVGWVVAIVCVLFSYMSSSKSYAVAIDQVDEDRIHHETPGGKYSSLTKFLDKVGGTSFLIAVFCICIFVAVNMKGASDMAILKAPVPPKAPELIKKGSVPPKAPPPPKPPKKS